MDRLVLSDAAWKRMAPLIIGRPDQRGSTGRGSRMFVEGLLWIVRTCSPWHDRPEVFGAWNSVFRRASRWSDKGVCRRIFEAMSDAPDFEYLIVDSTNPSGESRLKLSFLGAWTSRSPQAEGHGGCATVSGCGDAQAS